MTDRDEYDNFLIMCEDVLQELSGETFYFYGFHKGVELFKIDEMIVATLIYGSRCIMYLTAYDHDQFFFKRPIARVRLLSYQIRTGMIHRLVDLDGHIWLEIKTDAYNKEFSYKSKEDYDFIDVPDNYEDFYYRRADLVFKYYNWFNGSYPDVYKCKIIHMEKDEDENSD